MVNRQTERPASKPGISTRRGYNTPQASILARRPRPWRTSNVMENPSVRWLSQLQTSTYWGFKQMPCLMTPNCPHITSVMPCCVYDFCKHTQPCRHITTCILRSSRNSSHNQIPIRFPSPSGRTITQASLHQDSPQRSLVTWIQMNAKGQKPLSQPIRTGNLVGKQTYQYTHLKSRVWQNGSSDNRNAVQEVPLRKQPLCQTQYTNNKLVADTWVTPVQPYFKALQADTVLPVDPRFFPDFPWLRGVGGSQHPTRGYYPPPGYPPGGYPGYPAFGYARLCGTGLVWLLRGLDDHGWSLSLDGKWIDVSGYDPKIPWDIRRCPSSCPIGRPFHEAGTLTIPVAILGVFGHAIDSRVKLELLQLFMPGVSGTKPGEMVGVDVS
jgi:hypothetical protein